MLRILMVDDHAIVREGFKRLFEGDDGFVLVAEATTAQEAIQMAVRSRVDIAIVDLSLGDGDCNGLELVSRLAQVAPATKCVVLSMHDDPGLVVRALDNGARGYVSKAAAADELVGLLREVADGKVVLSSDLAANMRPQERPRLTSREYETLRGLLSDKPPKAVAIELGISDKTLYRHRANLMEKLGARTQGDLARIARERGLLLDP